MSKNTIDAEALLKWAQPQMTRESIFLYPNPRVLLQADANEFYEFVMAQTGMTPGELNATLDRLFPEESDDEEG